MEFKKRETMFGVSWVCEGPPFAAIRPNGGIYLSGDYTLEQLDVIMSFVKKLRAEMSKGRLADEAVG